MAGKKRYLFFMGVWVIKRVFHVIVWLYSLALVL